MNPLWIGIALGCYAVASGCFFFGHGPGRHRIAHCGTGLLTAGAVFNAIYLIARGLQAGNMPVASFGPSLILLALLVAVIGVGLMVRLRVRVIGLFVALAATVGVAAACMLGSPRRLVLPESLRSGWLPVHVTLAFLGYAMFLLAAGVSVIYLTYDSRLKSKRPLPGTGERVLSLETLDRINYRLLGWGFVMLSLAIVSGAIWADATWGHFWSWEPQESWSLVTWLLYAALLESRFTVGWRGRRAAALTIAVFTVLAGSFLGLSLMHPGHHSGNFD
ncbi:MAG TPA: cytochrome c biogenesis protein CcsA [Candidatus Binataceae bacterium]|nr:cytochrome c biogenesis protein CcsA [Candidatus Binataceae bacterium]